MDSQNLGTASVYLNNLLLSRGLLRNGKSVEFAKPQKADGGVNGTMAKVINLVHDMVLRRDREAEHREHLALVIRDLRETETRQRMEIERLKTKNADADRQLSVAQGQERAFKATLRTAENAARGLREEMLRLKNTLQQVRTQCANDIRKRDVQIQKLKSHLTTQQRGTRPALTTSTITINPSHSSALAAGASKDGVAGAVPLESPDYSLTQETTEFLTQLSQNLCDENDSLIGLLRSTLTTLRSLQGISDADVPASQPQDAADDGRGGDGESSRENGSSLMQTLPSSYDVLATDMDDVLEHLRTLLTNPSFVPLEEVEVREEEILRLREGWEKMEARWREAVQMMDGWRKRMASGGSSVNLDELKMGLRLSPVKVENGADFEMDDGLEEPSMSDGHSGSGTEDEDEGEDEGSEDLVEVLQEDDAEELENTDKGSLARGKILEEVHANVKPVRKGRLDAITTIVEEESISVSAKTSSSKSAGRASAKRARSNSPEPRADQSKRRVALEGSNGVRRSRLPQATTIQHKLDRAKTEAEQTERAKRIKERTEKIKPAPATVFRRARKSRRRSTLTTEELESLMGGDA